MDGEGFEWAVCSGRPAVYRRALDQTSDWVSVSWLLYESATAIRFESATETLVIDTPNGERRSGDGGLRWDVSPTVYEPKPIIPKMMNSVTSQGPGQESYLRVVNINGAPDLDDTVIEPMYQRPPYVYLAITTPGYPSDGSVPLWTGSMEDRTSGNVSMPRGVVFDRAPKVMRVEIRDFQFGTRTGSIPFSVTGNLEFKVEL